MEPTADLHVALKSSDTFFDVQHQVWGWLEWVVGVFGRNPAKAPTLSLSCRGQNFGAQMRRDSFVIDSLIELIPT